MDVGRVLVYEYKCKIVRVVDGDTVDVDIDLGFGVWMHKERIRLHGIDTPESRTRDLEEKKYGLLAKDQVEHFLPKGSIQTLVTVRDKAGKFGRILGEVWVNCNAEGEHGGWTNVNKWLCENGHAVGYTGQNKDDVKDEHWKNREYLAEHGKQELLQWDDN